MLLGGQVGRYLLRFPCDILILEFRVSGYPDWGNGAEPTARRMTRGVKL